MLIYFFLQIFNILFLKKWKLPSRIIFRQSSKPRIRRQVLITKQLFQLSDNRDKSTSRYLQSILIIWERNLFSLESRGFQRRGSWTIPVFIMQVNILPRYMCLNVLSRTALCVWKVGGEWGFFSRTLNEPNKLFKVQVWQLPTPQHPNPQYFFHSF